MVENSGQQRPFPLFTAAVLLMGLSLLFVVFFVVSKIIQENPSPAPGVTQRRDERIAALTKEAEQLRQNIDQERKNADQLRRQNADLVSQRAEAQKKALELADQLKAFQGDASSIRRWFMTNADAAPEKGWSLVPSVPPDKSSTAWKWTESTGDDIPIGGPIFACAGLLSTTDTTAEIEIRTSTPPMLWINHREIHPHASSPPSFRYRITLETGFNLATLHVPFNRSAPFFAARLTGPNGEILRTVRALSTSAEWNDFAAPARPAFLDVVARAAKISTAGSSSPTINMRKLLDPADLQSFEKEWKVLLGDGTLAFPLPSPRASAGNILWVPRWREEFDRESPGGAWRAASGTWKIHDGALCGRDDAEAIATSVMPVTGDVRIAYDAVLLEGRGDLSCLLFGTDQNIWRDGYFMGFGSNGNTHSKILRRGDLVERNAGALITMKKRHRVVVERIGDAVRMFVDGTLATLFIDPPPPSAGNVWGLYTYGTHAHFDNVIVSEGRRILAPEAEILRLAASKGGPELLKNNGVWESLIKDDFERTQIGNRWRSRNGTWRIDQGALCGQDIAEAVIMLDDRVPGNVRIEYDATMVGGERQSDLSIFLHGTAEKGYMEGYFAGFGSNANTRSKILRLGVEVATNGFARHTPGKCHRVVVEDIEGILRMWVDGEPILQSRDPSPVGGGQHGALGFYTFGAHTHFDNVRVFHMPSLPRTDWEDRLVQTMDGVKIATAEDLARLFGDPSTIETQGIAVLPLLRALSAADDPEARRLAHAMAVRLLSRPGALDAWEKAWKEHRASNENR